MSAGPASSVVLVTGGSRGIGRACALALGQLRSGSGAVPGLTIALQYRQDGAAAEAVVRALMAGGTKAQAFAADLSQPGAAARLVDEVAEALGGPTVLVHAAGALLEKPIAFTKAEEWAAQLELHALSACALSKALFRHVRLVEDGRIVFIGSLAGQTGLGNAAAYAASKGALAGLARSLALEAARWKATVNLIAPGYVETDLTAHHDEKRRAALVESIPLGRYGRAEEVAALAVFLCSPEAGYVTGQVLTVDGGLSLS